MLEYFKENKYIVTSLLAIILDGIILYYHDYYYNRLDLFYPMLTVSLIPYLYLDNKKNYYKTVFILGIVYDLLYSHIFLLNALLFLFLSIINIKILKNYRKNLLIYLFLTILNIIVYDFLIYILIIISNYQKVSFINIIYKIEHSLIINIIFSSISYFILKKRNILS